MVIRRYSGHQAEKVSITAKGRRKYKGKPNDAIMVAYQRGPISPQLGTGGR